MKTLSLLSVILGSALLASGCQRGGGNSVAADEIDTATPNTAAAPPREGRIVHAWDGCTMWATILNTNYYEKPNREIPAPAAQFSKRILEELVDEEAAAHVDAIAYCLFTAFWSDVPSSKVCDLFPWRPPGMDEAGMDPLKVLIDRCHHHGMKFIADVRMNDRHGARNGISKKHPEWIILGSANNYALEEVRNAMLTFTQEVLDGYEVDGVEYDYMRWCHMFERGEGAQNAHLLTDFTRKTRQLLDEAARRRGCDRLELGVRVPQSIAECDYLGFDLATWIQEGLVDYVVPSDFFHSDTNMKTDDFVKLAAGTACKIYPAIHPMISMDGPNEHYRLMNLANYRAAAQNFYGFGADGVSPYNYQRSFQRRAAAHRSSSNAAYMWPAALGWLRELRYPDQVSQRDRHYLFYAVYKPPHKSPTGFPNDENIYLARARPEQEGSRRFRMAEDFSDPGLRTTMQFKAVGLADDEKLDIKINGKQVPIDYITRVLDKNGQNVFEGDTLPPFYLYIIDMNWETTRRDQPLIFGDNELAVRLVPAEPGKSTASFRFADMVLGVQADDANGVSSVDLNGYLDDFAIWSRTLSADEIQTIYDSGQRGIGIKTSQPSNPAATPLDSGLRVLYEFENESATGANSAADKHPATQVGPGGAVAVDTKDPKIGTGAADFTRNDATLKVDANDVSHLMPGPGGSVTVSYWLKATSQTANHTVWGMSNLPIPSPLYSTNQAVAMLATQTIIVADPQQVTLGMVRPGTMGNASSEANVTDGKWHHIATTIDQDGETSGVIARLFIDGKEADVLTIAGRPTADSTTGAVSIEELECYVYVRN